MTRSTVKLILPVTLLLGLAAVAAAQSGAGREAFQDSGQLRKRTASAISSIGNYKDRLEKTRTALGRVRSSGGDARKHYKEFSKDLHELKKSQERAADEIEKMMVAGTRYFATWDQANAAISDPNLREASGALRSAMLERYIDIAHDLSNVAARLPQLMGRLDDLDAFLGANAGTENARVASDMIRDCRDDAGSLKAQIADVERRMKEFITEAPK